MQKDYDIAIIGAGVVGSMLAYQLSDSGHRIALIEKARDVCEGISKANSGVLHAGFNVPSGSLKARLNIEGLKLYPKLLKELKIPYKNCKKLVIAFDDNGKDHLKKLLEQGRANGCKGLRIIGHNKIKKINPKLQGKWALYSPMTGIVTPYQLTASLAENAVLKGVDMFLKSQVTAISPQLEITINDRDKIKCGTIINSAGIHAPKVANLLEPTPYQCYPCKGEYYVLDKKSGELLDLAVYPVPLSDGRSLGVHLTPTLNGNILIGPSAEYQNDTNDLGNSSVTMERLKEEAYKLLPELQNYGFIKNYAGLRPKLKPNGFSDFVIKRAKGHPQMINLMGIESPGLTAAPAIANHVIKDLLKIKTKKKKPLRFPSLSPREFTFSKRKKLVEKDPKYGEIICRCEEISRAEIESAINNPLGSKNMNTIKKRTHATMGRCQGSFCSSKISEILCENCHPSQIFKGEGQLYQGHRHE